MEFLGCFYITSKSPILLLYFAVGLQISWFVNPMHLNVWGGCLLVEHYDKVNARLLIDYCLLVLGTLKEK